MPNQQMNYTARETEDDVTIVDGFGEVVANFPDMSNPAFLAFVHGLTHFPSANLFWEGRAIYMVNRGELLDANTQRYVFDLQLESAAIVEAWKK